MCEEMVHILVKPFEPFKMPILLTVSSCLIALYSIFRRLDLLNLAGIRVGERDMFKNQIPVWRSI